VRFNRLVPFIALLAVFVIAVQPSVDTDSWWHLRSGEWILENKQILTSDPFSLTRQGQPWIYPGWLSQIALFSVFNIFGYAGLDIFTGLMVLIAFAFLWKTLEGKDLLRAFVLLLAAATSALYWSARPQIFTLVLASACLFLLEGARKGKLKRLWILPLLITLWVNMHGGFIVGYILIGIYFSAEVIEVFISVILYRRRIQDEWQNRKRLLSILVSVGAISILTGMINPHGPAILLYPFQTVSIGILQDYIAEWQSPNFHALEVQPFIILLFLTLLALGISNKKRSASELLLISIFGYMSLVAVRNVSLFALVAAPTVCRHLQAGLNPLFERVKSKKDFPEKLANSINVIIAVLLTFIGLVRVVTQLGSEINLDAINQQIPLKAFEFIEDENPAGRLFNSYNWGGYVIWALYPDHLSFVDGRTDLFSDEILEKYLNAWLAKPGWDVFLDEWNIQWALLEIDSPLSQAMINNNWQVLYSDEQSIILDKGGVGFDR
jgi:hypothetical protein